MIWPFNIVIFRSLTEVADEKKLNATPNKLLLIKYISLEMYYWQSNIKHDEAH